MIEWHSHILPGMDDGSRDMEQSLSMLGMFVTLPVIMLLIG